MVDPSQNNSPISPYSYGSNNVITNNPTNSATPTTILVQNIPLYRQGGNRMTAYNWENNASNSGTDYKVVNGGVTYTNHEDNYMFPPTVSYGNDTPATTLLAFIEGCNAVTAASLVTLQMAGYVSINPTCNCFVSTIPIGRRSALPAAPLQALRRPTAQWST
jgi:mannan endo-1,4-beta-mannosidase